MRSSFADQVATLMMIFGVMGAFIGGYVPIERGGELGAVLGCITAIFIGVMWWLSPRRHRHKWERGIVYDQEGRERFMLKFCRCGEIKFDGYIHLMDEKKEITASNRGKTK